MGPDRRRGRGRGWKPRWDDKQKRRAALVVALGAVLALGWLFADLLTGWH